MESDYGIPFSAVLSRYVIFLISSGKPLLEPWKTKRHASSDSNSISSFQALCTAVASCVGSGNIVGVSTAVLAGGLGAIFWMWVAAFVGMATKYGEIILGLLYRVKNEDGTYSGGPMYYIRDGLHAPVLASLCAFFMVIQIIGGNFIQSNTISSVMKNHLHIPEGITGVILVILIFTISAGGLKRLARITQKLVPAMALLYVVSGLVIILLHITSLPDVILNIVTGAFGLRPVLAGTAGSMIIAMQKGIARGLYSNEAGEGSAPVIHSAANVQHPVEQGITGVTEVFLDTFVICTISGLVLGVTGVLDSGLPGKHSDDTRFFHSVGSSEISGHHQPAFILHHHSDESVVLRFCWPKLSVRSPDRGKIQVFFPAILHDRIYYRHRHCLDHSGYCPGPAHHS